MSFLDYIPGVAHIKAGVHLICNDKEGADRTMETLHTKSPGTAHLMAGIAKLAGDDETAKKRWDGGNNSLDALPVLGHAKGIIHYACLDVEGGNKAMVDATSTTLNIADGIPVVGHTKGLVHYACGDVEGGNKAMKSATRTTAVMGAGAGGFVVAGPAGAVAAGVSTGAGWDITNANLTDGKEVNGVAKIIDNPKSVDSYFDAGLSLFGDGLAGYSGGKIAEKAMAPSSSDNLGAASKVAGGNTDLAAAAEQLVEDYNAGKISWTEYNQKWDAIKPKGGFIDNVPVKVNAEQLNNYYSKGFITKAQYNQAMSEMATNGGGKTTVFLNGSASAGTTSTGGSQEPPQQPNKKNRPVNTADEIQELINWLTELLDEIRQHILRAEETGEWSPNFQRQAFHKMFTIVAQLIAYGYRVKIKDGRLIIKAPNGSQQVIFIEDQVSIFLDVQEQLSSQQFAFDPQSPCPTVLVAGFDGIRLVLSRDDNDIHHNITYAIYGIRCRICDHRGPFEVCDSNANYVGQSKPGVDEKRSVHVRVCGEHRSTVETAINNFYAGRGLTVDRNRPMYQHAAEHFIDGDLPTDTQPEDAFRMVMDVIIMPTGHHPVSNTEELRSWECFWQFFFHCRKKNGGWSQR